MKQGLTAFEAKSLIEKIGFNELPSSKPKNLWKIASEVLREPMFLLLLGSGTLYIILGDYREGLILLSTIFVIIGITFYQYQKTERALEALKDLSSPRALVLRDGRKIRIAGREVVPGDVIVLNEGDRIVADATLIESLNLTVDESLLTGESVPVRKTIVDGSSNLFGATLIVQGKGIAKVDSTGIHTQFGKIGQSLKDIESKETRLQLEMKELIKKLAYIGIFLSLSIVGAFYLSRGNFVKSLLNGLAAAMAIMPEEFSVVLTIFLALGAWRLSQKKVLTRRPSAIEILGSATVLCSDKTGTITQNKMEVVVLNDGNQTLSKEDFKKEGATFLELVRSGHRASQRDSIDPMEQAIDRAYKEIFSQTEEDLRLVQEYPLSKELLAMTRVQQNAADQAISVSAKGAPETIFKLCHLGEVETAKYLQVVTDMAEQGYRVLAVAVASPPSVMPDTQSDFHYSFKGLIGFADPIRPEVPKAILECQEAGIKVLMITGDFPATAKSIAAQIGLPSHGKILTGSELALLSDDDLREQIKIINIFARIIPDQKLRIVEALKANGEIVAMTGDGVNDAPALKAAHIGIAMGSRGTDVAREASSLVLLDDNFASIVSAIHLGRRIFDNLQKAMSYIMAIHVPIIGLTLLPAFFSSLPILLLPLHIVFLELIVDPVCAIAFETEQDEKGIMKRKPRSPKDSFFGTKRIFSSVFAGSLLLVSVLIVYFLSLNEGHTEGEVRAIAFSSLILGNVFLTLTDLSKTRSFLSVFTERNWVAISILMASLTIMLLIISVPGLRLVFNFEFPGYEHFIPSLISALTILFVLESLKYRRKDLSI
jgi:Ca2+-transporting ATPase